MEGERGGEGQCYLLELGDGYVRRVHCTILPTFVCLKCFIIKHLN